MDLDPLRRLAERTPGLTAMLLFGSRARGDAHERSDWDVGFLGEGVDAATLRAELTRVLGTDAVDVVDLARASALLRYRAARDGQAIFEVRPGRIETFRIEAATFWCDVGPVVAAAHERLLAELGP